MLVTCVLEISHAVDLSQVLYVCDLCYCMCVTCVIVYVCDLCTRNITCCRPVLNLVCCDLCYCMVCIVRSHSLCSWDGLKETKPFKIKGLFTYVFYITIVIIHNMCAQLLTLQNGVYSQDLYYRVITRFY